MFDLFLSQDLAHQKRHASQPEAIERLSNGSHESKYKTLLPYLKKGGQWLLIML